MRFYLGKQPRQSANQPYPATGLYYYKKTGPNSFEQHLIGPKGEIKPHPSAPGKSVNVQPIDSPDPIRAGAKLDKVLSAWFFAPMDNGQEGYLALLPVQDNSRIIRYPEGLETQGQNYFLSNNVQRLLRWVLRFLLDQGYDRMYQALSLDEPVWLLIGAPFWEAIHRVGNELYRRFSEERFDDKFLIFHLIRTLSEGFIEGHAHHFTALGLAPALASKLVISANYETDPGGGASSSTAAWAKVLKTLSDDKVPKLSDITSSPSFLDDDERQAFTIMATVLAERLPLADSLNESDRLDLLGIFINLLTPGRATDASISLSEPDPAEMAFWYLHFPHWYRDMVYALRNFDKTPSANQLNSYEEDWGRIRSAILSSFPKKHVSIFDQIVGNLMRSLANMPGFAALLDQDFLIEGILNNARKLAKQ
jgi:hypothetical protein